MRQLFPGTASGFSGHFWSIPSGARKPAWVSNLHLAIVYVEPPGNDYRPFPTNIGLKKRAAGFHGMTLTIVPQRLPLLIGSKEKKADFSIDMLGEVATL
jgi:hypothetical protein